jgi:hypothetical protein
VEESPLGAGPPHGQEKINGDAIIGAGMVVLMVVRACLENVCGVGLEHEHVQAHAHVQATLGSAAERLAPGQVGGGGPCRCRVGRAQEQA